ncbi:MAG: acetyl-CoA carboxylase biotin carboxyl carrier protein [Pararhodobacter sp.]|nr:acetyl-CoA carboxylase biotin carboxyl carrier protein [Pararhodobacter sp.]
MSKDRNTADVAFIKALAELLEANNLTEIEVERSYDENDSLCVRVSKHAPQPVQPAPAASALPAAAAPAPAAQAAVGKGSGDDPADLPGAVNSPMVGTAYLAAEPGAEPFVKIGDQVSVGQTLMIIEAMKTMNQIPAPHAGIVKRILVEDGTPVEYGAPLMIVE